jgi:hypothetical protein
MNEFHSRLMGAEEKKMSDNSGDKSVLGCKDEIIKRLHQKAAGKLRQHQKQAKDFWLTR